MSIATLEKYLPPDTLPFLKQWFGTHVIHIRITRDRHSKLGDYRKERSGGHQITVNSTLEPHLFFFVLTHELAHLLAFHNYGFRIAPHGKEWKHTFGEMLMDSLSVYPEDLQGILRKFALSPKANYMSSPDLVRYFNSTTYEDEIIYVEDIPQGREFEYRSQRYLVEGKRKKNYLCKQLDSGKQYVFSPLVQVRQINN